MTDTKIDWDKPLQVTIVPTYSEWFNVWIEKIYLNQDGSIHRRDLRLPNEISISFNEQGQSLFGNWLIRNKPEKKKLCGWVNVYPEDRYGAYKTRRAADDCAVSSRVACVYIEKEYEEGEGL